MASEPDIADAGGGAEGELTATRIGQRLGQARFLRRIALVLAGALLILAGFSGAFSAASLLSAALLGVIALGWRTRETAGPRSGDPVRAERSPTEIRLATVLDAISSPTILIDHRGHLVHSNAAALNAFQGLRQGNPVTFAIRAPALHKALDAVLRGQGEARAEIIDRIPMERSFDVVISRLGTIGSEPPAINGMPFAIIFMTETTAARRIEAMRVDFVANASHELRTPLASILGFIETLQGPARDDVEARRNFLEIMEKQARRMARLIEDLLSLSKIEMSAHIAPSESVDLGLLLRSVCDALAGLAQDRGVALRVAPAEGPFVVVGDRDELLRVFENLIENALKYGQGGGAIDIALALHRDSTLGDAVSVSVRDYGPGIAEEHLPRLTERFYRADVNESRVLGGTGLGLAIVKHIVTRHRGRLGIASRLGDGATFTVTIPAANRQ